MEDKKFIDLNDEEIKSLAQAVAEAFSEYFEILFKIVDETDTD